LVIGQLETQQLATGSWQFGKAQAKTKCD